MLTESNCAFPAGEFYFSFEFLDSWDKELKRMNQGKKGKPFEYPETLVQFSGLMYEFLHLPYRQLEGALRKLSSFIPSLKAADYTTLWHRITKLALDLPTNDKEVVVAVDSTGVKVTNRGEWMRKKWCEKNEKDGSRCTLPLTLKLKSLSQ